MLIKVPNSSFGRRISPVYCLDKILEIVPNTPFPQAASSAMVRKLPQKTMMHMNHLPPKHQQIITLHATFICQVVQLSQAGDGASRLKTLLQQAEESGWQALAGAIRQIVAGQRELQRIQGLDEEDRVIAEAILRGLQDPASLPDPEAKPEATLAAPGLAGMIQAAASGNVQALTLISNMAQQMSRAGGPMARLAAVIRPLINGERDPDTLCRGMDEQTRQLTLDILAELKRLQAH